MSLHYALTSKARALTHNKEYIVRIFFVSRNVPETFFMIKQSFVHVVQYKMLCVLQSYSYLMNSEDILKQDLVQPTLKN